VSSTKLDGVAVNLGGNCGGFRYAAGAMLLFISGRWTCVENVYLLDLRYWSSEGERTPKRREARIAERAMKKAMATRKTREKREVATVVTSAVYQYMERGRLLYRIV